MKASKPVLKLRVVSVLDTIKMINGFQLLLSRSTCAATARQVQVTQRMAPAQATGDSRQATEEATMRAAQEVAQVQARHAPPLRAARQLAHEEVTAANWWATEEDAMRANRKAEEEEADRQVWQVDARKLALELVTVVNRRAAEDATR